MAWQDVATQLLGPQAPDVIQRLTAINPSFDWSGPIQQYVPALNAAYGEDWKDLSRGSSAGIVSALLKNVQASGQEFAGAALPAAQQAQQADEARIQQGQYHPSGGGLGDLLTLGALGLGGFGLAGMGPLSGLAGLFGGGAAAGSSLGAMAAPAGLAEEMAALGIGGGGSAAAGAGALSGGAELLNGGGYSGGVNSSPTSGGTDFAANSLADQNMGFTGGDATGTATSGVSVPAGFGSALGTGAGQAAAGTALQRILNGTGTAADFASVLGTGGAALLGAGVANKQTDAFKTLSDQFIGMGAPSRARYEASYAPGFTMSDDPGYMDSLNQSAKAATHAMSIGGNPAASPNAWTQTLQDLQQRTAYPALQQYRNQNAATGGIANFSSAVPGAATTAIQSQSAAPNVLSAGLSDIFNPKPSQTQLLSQFSSLFGRG